jgi:hypothetical protein
MAARAAGSGWQADAPLGRRRLTALWGGVTWHRNGRCAAPGQPGQCAGATTAAQLPPPQEEPHICAQAAGAAGAAAAGGPCAPGQPHGLGGEQQAAALHSNGRPPPQKHQTLALALSSSPVPDSALLPAASVFISSTRLCAFIWSSANQAAWGAGRRGVGAKAGGRRPPFGRPGAAAGRGCSGGPESGGMRSACGGEAGQRSAAAARMAGAGGAGVGGGGGRAGLGQARLGCIRKQGRRAGRRHLLAPLATQPLPHAVACGAGHPQMPSCLVMPPWKRSSARKKTM